LQKEECPLLIASSAHSASDLTYYHYKLVRKIKFRPESLYSYLVAALAGAAALSIIYGWIALLVMPAALGMMLALHAIVLKLTVRRIDEPWEKRFAFRTDWPWFGPLPVMDTNLGVFRRLHYHLFLVGSCAAAIIYPWLGSAWTISLFFIHLWLLSPRIQLMWKLRRELRDGVIRLNGNVVFYYHR
jgi:hypothetical protein